MTDNQMPWYQMLDATIWFIVLACLIGAFASNWWVKFVLVGITFGLGAYVALKHNPHYYILTTVLVGILGVVVFGFIFRPQARLQFLRLTSLSLAPGTPILANVTFLNRGEFDATAVDVAYVKVDEPPPTDATAQRRFEDKLFRTHIEGKQPILAAETVPPGSQHVQTNWGALYTPEHARDVASGKKAIYFLGTVRYRDWLGQHHIDYCRFFYNGQFRRFEATTRS